MRTVIFKIKQLKMRQNCKYIFAGEDNVRLNRVKRYKERRKKYYFCWCENVLSAKNQPVPNLPKFGRHIFDQPILAKFAQIFS